jgi:hypothetical protein
LPGVARSDLRAVEECPRELRPLAELQYRGIVFGHPNGKDWSPAAFLSNSLGVEIPGGARDSLARALPEMLDREAGDLRAMSPLTAADLDSMLSSRFWRRGGTR